MQGMSRSVNGGFVYRAHNRKGLRMKKKFIGLVNE